ncbi:hypothetical protein DS743_03970 [Lactobacillus leichmannii]|uniref:Uncharacterized protein n=1 Tax=Lactobacillus leichmannii TaxID=28039 RepID=A0ABT1XWJ9_LACLE|nr:hypothetical protein LL035_08540 [Lactobacillus delbrueckii subsp. lactis]MCR5970998.1 hypothetical protein [Lactobacillus leichmannii]
MFVYIMGNHLLPLFRQHLYLTSLSIVKAFSVKSNHFPSKMSDFPKKLTFFDQNILKISQASKKDQETLFFYLVI